MRRLLRTVLAATILAAGLAPISASADDPDELIPCKFVHVKELPHIGGRTRFRCEPPPGGSFPLPWVGAGVELGGVNLSMNVVPPGTIEVPVSPWGASCRPFGTPVKGYRCSRVTQSPEGRLLIKENVVRGSFSRDLLGFYYGTTRPYAGDVAIKITFSYPPQKRYCARFGGTIVKNDARQYRAEDAPAPAACSPSGAFLDADRF